MTTRYIPQDKVLLEHFQNHSTDRSGYLRGLALDHYLNPNNDRSAHYLARELFYLNRPKSAIKLFQKHIDMKRWPAERAQSFIFMGQCYDQIGDGEKAEECFHKAIQVEPSRRIGWIRLAERAARLGQPNRVVTFIQSALTLPWSGFYADDRFHYEAYPHELASWAYMTMGDRAKAKEHWEKALAFAPHHPTYLTFAHAHIPTPPVSIVIPTLGRTEKLLRLLKLIKDNAFWPEYEVIVVHDGEPVLDSYPIPLTAVANESRQGAPKSLNRGVSMSKHDLVMFLGNDCEPRPGFITHAVKEMWDSFGSAMDGLVGLNDEYWTGELATHWLASKRLLPVLDGMFFNDAYEHCGCDSELTERCRKAGKFIYAENAKVGHDHPAKKGWQGMDDTYRIAYDEERLKRDKATFQRRAKEFGFRVTGPFHEPRKYPTIPLCVDMRERLKRFGEIRDMRVLNVGMGSGKSWIASQLPLLKFRYFFGIDVHEPYLEDARKTIWDAYRTDFRKTDVRDMLKMINSHAGWDIITGKANMVFAFDVLEHLPKEDSLEVLRKIEESGSDALVFIPIEDEARENDFGVESQDHLSFWKEEDFKARGWETELLPNFHGDGKRVWPALWASWKGI